MPQVRRYYRYACVSEQVMRIHAISVSPMSEAQKRRLGVLGDLKYYESTLDDVNVGELCRGAQILVVSPRISVDIVPCLSDCQMISVQAVGTDVINLSAARDKNITVCNVPEFCTDAVAEHTFAIMLGLAKRIEAGRALMKAGEWHSPLAYKTLGLRGKTLGILGLGKIGNRIAEIGVDGFGMRVIATVLDASRPRSFQTVAWERLLSESDFLVIAAPLTSRTRGIFNRSTFMAVKPSALLVNISRAAIVDDAALLEALNEGQLAGAAVDVFHNEPPSPEDPLLNHRRVLVTPHIAWGTVDAVERLLDTSIMNVEAFLAGKPINVVS